MSLIAQERRQVFYPNQRYIKMIVGRSFVKGISKSKIIEEGVRLLFDSLPEKEQQMYIKAFDALSREDRKRPNRA